jgi:aldehyde:ferredoxin oxidoreductase
MDMKPYGNIDSLKAKHRIVSTISYEPVKPTRGYTRKILRVDVGTEKIEIHDVDQQMVDLFVGGRGFDLRLMWDEVTPKTTWRDPENPICVSSGPLGGTTSFSGSGKSIVTSISPATGAPVDSNVGGYFGPLLKFSGFDALVVVGKSKEERVVVIDGAKKKISIESAPNEEIDSHLVAEQLCAMYAEHPDDRINVSTISSGRGAQHTLIGCLNFSWFDDRRKCVRLKQAGRGGTGTVLRNKKIKAIVVHSPPWRAKVNYANGGGKEL